MPSENVGNCPHCGEKLVWVGRNPSSLMCPLCVDREIFESDETWTPLTRLGPGPLSREEMDRQLQGVVDRLIARTKPAAAPVEEKEGSEEPNPLVGEKAPDSAGATLAERLAAIVAEAIETWGPTSNAPIFASRILYAVADDMHARGEHQVVAILRTEAER